MVAIHPNVKGILGLSHTTFDTVDQVYYIDCLACKEYLTLYFLPVVWLEKLLVQSINWQVLHLRPLQGAFPMEMGGAGVCKFARTRRSLRLLRRSSKRNHQRWVGNGMLKFLRDM